MAINLGYNYTETEREEGLEEVVRHNQVLNVVGWPCGHKPGVNCTKTEGEEGLAEVVRHNQVLDIVGWPCGHKPGL